MAGFFTEPLEPNTGKPCENSLKTHLIVLLFFQGEWDPKRIDVARVWIVGLSRFVIIVVLRPLLQDEPELQPDEEGLVARALGGPVLGAGGAQEEQG